MSILQESRNQINHPVEAGRVAKAQAKRATTLDPQQRNSSDVLERPAIGGYLRRRVVGWVSQR
jgi:hypothetical protein